MGQSGVNEYYQKEAFSHSNEEVWERVYKEYFPTLVKIETVDDKERQLKGIDRLIYLESGEVIAVDEKLREDEWNDILLEFISNDTTGALGWIEKNQETEYIFYMFKQSGRVYALPFKTLQIVWRKYRDQWIAWAGRRTNEFRLVLAENYGYTTHSVAVPIKWISWGIWQVTGQILFEE